VTFEHPWRLLLLLGLAVLVVLYLLAQRRRGAYAVRLTTLPLLDKVAPRRPEWRRHVPAVAFLAALGLLVLGFAQPTANVTVAKEEATIVLAIDVSNSMQATDVAPSRLAAAQEAATSFVKNLPENINVGLVQFAQNANLVVAPTQEHGQVTDAIADLQLAPSTAIGEAVFASLAGIADTLGDDARTVPTAGAPSQDPNGTAPGAAAKVPARIVLMSDGTNTVGRSPEEAAKAAVDAGVPVSTIAYGTPDGTVTIQGEVIPVPVDSDALARLAENTGGTAYKAASGEELKSVYKDIGSSLGDVVERREVTVWFVGLALLAALAAAAASLRWFARLP
jgi:Ca-activated chloride channel family protein